MSLSEDTSSFSSSAPSSSNVPLISFFPAFASGGFLSLFPRFAMNSSTEYLSSYVISVYVGVPTAGFNIIFLSMSLLAIKKSSNLAKALVLGSSSVLISKSCSPRASWNVPSDHSINLAFDSI